ncbi:MAG: phospholipase D family protein [Spirochaetales bacterium]|nr:phospholipase D family protein [Spirochaetales bacterium]
MVEFRSAAAFRELRDSLVREWNAYSMDKLRAGEFPARGDKAGDCLWLVHQDSLSERLVGEMFSRFMDAAEREIWLIQSYPLPDRSILKRVRELTARGVSVNIFYSSTFHELDEFFHSTGYRMVDLIEAGAQLWECGSRTSHLHYKGVIIDDQWFTVGSAILENLEEIKANSRRITADMAGEYRGLRFLFFGG